MFFGASINGALFRFRFNPMTTRKLRPFLRNYYRNQGGFRPKPRVVAAHPVPGIVFDLSVVAIFVVLGVAYLF
jgi:hypothetical protein